MVRNTLLTEKIRCEEELAEDLPLTCGDAQGFQQVILNLITNARAAMKDGGTLRVRTRATPEGVEIEVSDTGHGIPRANLERVFDPFFTTKAPGEGTGLGLAISHEIIDQAGGRITVDSRDRDEAGPGRCGTTFRVTLPAASRSSGSVQTAATA
jgi:two-component system NtrC family sensor kinase